MDIDFERASALMDVIQKITTVSPKNTNLLGLAMEELAELEAGAKTMRDDLIAKRKAAEIEEAGRVAAEHKRLRDEEAAANEVEVRRVPRSIPSDKIDTTPGQPNPAVPANGEPPVISHEERRI